MPDGQVLEFTNVTKRFNEVTAVSDFSARVEPGAVTAFLGPNGAGKTTTLRMLLGQVRATSGTATIGGTAFAELRQPLRIIGSVLEETVYRPRRTANRQLTIAAKANGIPLARVGEVLALVGLEGEGDARIGGYSLGMRQRLSVAHALLGDPGALVFDEPANGLDPEGIRWMRMLLRRLADEGRTVLVSSHLLSEVEQIADNVLVLSKGQLVLDSGIETLADPKAGSVVVDAADRTALTAALSAAGFDVEVLRSGLTVRGGDASTVGVVAAAAGIALSTLMQRGPTLEDVFIELVRGGKLGPRAEAAASQLVANENLGAFGASAGVAGIAGTAVREDVPVSDDVASDVSDAAGPDGETDAAPEGEESSAEDAVDENATLEGAADENVTDDGSVEEAVTHENAPAADSVEESSTDEEIAVEDETSEGSDEGRPEDAPSEAPSDEATPRRSFDEILFGASASAPSAEPDGARDWEESADSEGAEGSEGSEGSEAEGADATAPDGESTVAAGDHAGVEFFAEIGDTDAAGEAASGDVSDADASDADDVSHDAESEGDAAEYSVENGDEDPRSAAVSTMLAAAARAYYEDEPKDYPQGEAASDDGAHGSVASTGIIDTVPLESSENAPEGGDVEGGDVEGESVFDDEVDSGEHGDSDLHDGENHDGDQHGENSHHG